MCIANIFLTILVNDLKSCPYHAKLIDDFDEIPDN